MKIMWKKLKQKTGKIVEKIVVKIIEKNCGKN